MIDRIEMNKLMYSSQTKQYKFIEGFSGPGGMSTGLIRAGFQLQLAFDINERAVETHNLNHENKCLVLDASRIDGKELLRSIGIDVGELDLFAGGPPCQGFSKQKRGAHKGDARNGLINEYIRLVKQMMPRAFFFENVAIFGQKRGKQYVDTMRTELIDYDLYPNFYNCSDFGLAQTRERFVIVGIRTDLDSYFAVPHKKPIKVTVGEILNGLPEPPFDYSEHPDFPNHQRARVSEINIERFSHVPQGGGWQDIPWDLRLPCHKKVDVKSGGWPDVYGRLEWDGFCPTITGGFDSFTRGRYGHPLQDRPLTPREAARLQGFDDDFKFVGTRADVRSQIGNAVPPPLANAIGLEIKRALYVGDGVINSETKMKKPLRQIEMFT